MVRTTIMLPENLKNRIESKAKKMHMSLGEYLRKSARDALLADEQRFAGDPLSGDSYIIPDPSPARVSENVDKYLYGKTDA